MVKKLNQQFVRETLLSKGMVFFTPREFRLVFNVSQQTANLFIHRQTKKKFFLKLRNGLYCISDNLPDDLELANRLYQPSYVSFEFALSYYHLIPESVYTITSATTKASRNFSSLGKHFLYHRIRRDFFIDYIPAKSGGRTILIATPEKALIDYLYFVYLGKKGLLERLDLSRIPFSNLKNILNKYDQNFVDFIRGLYDRYKNHQAISN